jgi:hypothetical protein
MRAALRLQCRFVGSVKVAVLPENELFIRIVPVDG